MLHSLVLAAMTTATEASPASTEAIISGGSLNILLLLLAGVLLIFLEIVVPGGFLGTLGGVLILFAVIVAAREHGGPTAVLVLAIGLIASVAAIVIGWHYLPKTRLGEKMFLTPSPGLDAPPATPDAKAKAAVRPGDRGVSLSDLHPAGLARMGDWRLDVVTRGEYIEVGTPIVIVSIDGTRVVVRADAGEAPPSAGQ